MTKKVVRSLSAKLAILVAKMPPPIKNSVYTPKHVSARLLATDLHTSKNQHVQLLITFTAARMSHIA